jgi:hypothetical protein
MPPVRIWPEDSASDPSCGSPLSPPPRRQRSGSIFIQAQATDGFADPAYAAAVADSQGTSRKALNTICATNNLQAIVAPTNSPAWTTDLVDGDHFELASTGPEARARFPLGDRPRSLHLRSARRADLDGPGFPGAHADQTGFRLRAGHEGADATDVPENLASIRARIPWSECNVS